MCAQLPVLVREASQALARLDAGRLEELASSCQVLNPFDSPDTGDRARMNRQAQSATEDMAVFARVLAATRANLEVMRRLEELRKGKIEYSAGWGGALAPLEDRRGNH